MCHDLAKQLSQYLFFFYFSLITEHNTILRCVQIPSLPLTTTISSLLAIMTVGGTTILPNLLH